MIVKTSSGSSSKLAEILGQSPEFFKGQELVRVDFSTPSKLGLKFPSGNEIGANSKWLPGGFLPEGHSEAVLNLDGQSENFWNAIDLDLN